MFETESSDASGVVLVAHGLNNKPDVMNSLIGVLRAEGFHCLRISLHEDEVRGVSPTVIADRWLNTFKSAYVRLAAGYPSLPISVLSYSLGALTTIKCLDVHPTLDIERMVLIAPPVALTWSASLVRLLTPLARFELALPSAAPREVRARRATPLKEYAAMLDISKDVRTLRNPDVLGAIPTEVILDPDDELVSYAGVLSWLRTQKLGSWTGYRLHGRQPEGRTYAHLMVLEKSLGSSAWLTLTERIIKHLRAA